MVLNLLSEMLMTGLASEGFLELSFARLGALVANTCESLIHSMVAQVCCQKLKKCCTYVPTFKFCYLAWYSYMYVQ